jgi:7-cyano-7-deazaguanine synthase
MTPDGKKAIVLLSGGIDSATCAALARKQGFSIYALSFRYGQRHSFELHAAEKLAALFGVREHSIITIDLRAFGGSALTSSLEVPKNRAVHDPALNDIPVTYVPARNIIFLSYALAWAEVIACNDIFIGVNAVDYSGYPDCRPLFIRSFEDMANVGTKAGVEGRRYTIHAPLIEHTKATIIKTGIACGIDYGMTHSCYDPSPEGLACGACDSCQIRKKGFADAGVPDPTHYV